MKEKKKGEKNEGEKNARDFLDDTSHHGREYQRRNDDDSDETAKVVGGRGAGFGGPRGRLRDDAQIALFCVVVWVVVEQQKREG